LILEGQPSARRSQLDGRHGTSGRQIPRTSTGPTTRSGGAFAKHVAALRQLPPPADTPWACWAGAARL